VSEKDGNHCPVQIFVTHPKYVAVKISTIGLAPNHSYCRKSIEMKIKKFARKRVATKGEMEWTRVKDYLKLKSMK